MYVYWGLLFITVTVTVSYCSDHSTETPLGEKVYFHVLIALFFLLKNIFFLFHNLYNCPLVLATSSFLFSLSQEKS